MAEQTIREGMRVLSPTGEQLGRVSAVGETHFEVEPSRIRLREFDVELSHVASIRADEVVLRHGLEDLVPIHDDDGGALAPRGSGNLGAEPVNDDTSWLI